MSDVMAKLSSPEVAAFCRRWKIVELAVFGSRARGEPVESSDLDLLVTFADDAEWSLLDHVRMQEELGELLGCPVDLVSRRAIERSRNPLRRREILGTARRVAGM